MPRKFLTPFTLLVSNYGANGRVCQFTYFLGTWVEGPPITTELGGWNLIGMSIGKATLGNCRCLKTDYSGGKVTPINCINGVWTAGTPVSVPGGGRPATVAISRNGVHALVGGDYKNGLGALKFDLLSGTWVGNGMITIPESHTDSVAISPDGLLGMCMTKYGSNAYPFYRNPSTDVWTAGSAIPIGFGGQKFDCLSFNLVGDICLMGSNAGVNGKAAFWDGSTWTLSATAVPAKFAESRWIDDTTIIATSRDATPNAVYILKYDPISKTFSVGQTISFANGPITSPAIPELGRRDIATVNNFSVNQIIPLHRVGEVWSAGTPVGSSNFDRPLGAVIMPVV